MQLFIRLRQPIESGNIYEIIYLLAKDKYTIDSKCFTFQFKLFFYYFTVKNMFLCVYVAIINNGIYVYIYIYIEIIGMNDYIAIIGMHDYIKIFTI